MADIPLPDAGRGGDARAHGNRPAAPVRKIIRVKARRICPLAGWLARQRFDPAPLPVAEPPIPHGGAAAPASRRNCLPCPSAAPRRPPGTRLPCPSAAPRRRPTAGLPHLKFFAGSASAFNCVFNIIIACNDEAHTYTVE